MGEKIVFRKVWNEDGVSEVFGDMLILVMTMTLFAGVFLIVYSLPTPNEDVHAEFESSLGLCDEGGRFNLTHVGGETLRGDYTKIYVYKNHDEEIRILDTQGSDEDNPSYGIEGDTNWDTGETWKYLYKDITAEDDIRISVIDMKTNAIVMNSRLLGKGFNAPPIIMERWYHPEPAVNNSKITIFAKVFEPNGNPDLDEVYFNASILNPDIGNVIMENLNGDEIFEAEVLISSGAGRYEMTIIASDVSGNIDRTRLNLSVEKESRPIIELVVIEPNSVEKEKMVTIRAVVVDLNDDLNFSDVSVNPEQKFYDNLGSMDTSFELIDEIPKGGIFETNGTSPKMNGIYNLSIKARDYQGLTTTKLINLAIIENAGQGNDFNDSIWAYLGPESLDFRKFYYTIDNPPTEASTYYLAVNIEEDHIGNDCYLHINVINHYYEDVYIDGHSKIRLLQIGGAASNKDITIVQNGSEFGEQVGTTPDGTWYRIPASEDGDYFHGGDPVSLVFGPFDMSSAKEGDVFGSILVLAGSYGSESVDPENRYGQTLPFQAIVIG